MYNDQFEEQYLKLLNKVLTRGILHVDRTGIGRYSLYGEQIKFDLSNGFPLVTTRKVPYKSIIKELLWFIAGGSNNKDLTDQNVNIWNSWCVKESDIDKFIEKHKNIIGESHEVFKIRLKERYLHSIGNMYGFNWRAAPIDEVNLFLPDIKEEDIASDKLNLYKLRYEIAKLSHDNLDWNLFLKSNYYSHIDQLQQLIVNLKKRPYSSRHIVNNWIPAHVPFEDLSPQENVLLGRGALAACHTMFQCFVLPYEKPKLSMMLTQRSCDLPVGAVFNIAQYSLLLCMLASILDYEPHEFIYSLGDVHIYANQKDLVRNQLERTNYLLPTLELNKEIKDLYKFKESDIVICNYNYHDAINYPVAV